MGSGAIKLHLGYRALFANAVFSTAAVVASLLASLYLAPKVLAALGDVNYGAWSFTESFIAYLTLFDLGIAAAIVRLTPRCIARDDIDELNRVYSASIVFFLGAMAVAIAIGAAFEVFLLPYLLHAPELSGEFRWLFRLLVFNFAISLPLSIFHPMLDGIGRFGFKSAVRTAVIAARVPLTLWVIRGEHRLIGLGLVITVCTLVENVLLAVGAHSFVKGLQFRPASVSRATVRQIAGYSRDAFVAMVSGRLAFHADALVIAPVLGAASVTIFAIPAHLVEMGKSLLRSATMTLTGVFSTLEANDDHDRIRATFLTSSRAAWYAALPLAAGLLTLGYPFLSIWVGPKHAELCWPVLVALALPLALSIAQSVAARVLYGTGRLKWFARATVLEGVTNLVVSLALIKPWGVTGVAVGTAIPHTLFCLWAIGYVCRVHAISWRSYLTVAMKPLLAVIVPTLIWIAAERVGIDNWSRFFLMGTVGMIAYALAAAMLEVRSVFQHLKARSDRSTPDQPEWRIAG